MVLKLSDANILITGGNGFIGSHLAEELIKENANVFIIDNNFTHNSFLFIQNIHKKVTIIKQDICDYQKLFKSICRFKIDIIFHLAAKSLVGDAYKYPKDTLTNNINGTINILEAVRLYGKVKTLIIASSDKAYGKLNGGKYREEDALSGDHPYEVSKSCSDQIAKSFHKTYKIPMAIARFGNVYGEGDLSFSRIIPGIMKSFVHNSILVIRSNGKYVRDYINIKDVVWGYITLMNNIGNANGETFNFSSDDTFSVVELLRFAQKVLSKKLKYDVKNTAANEIPYQTLDYSKAKKMLGWKPIFTMKETLPGIYSWYKKYYSNEKQS